MGSWRDIILQEFVPNVNKLTLVSDQDFLLTEENLVAELYNRGFEIIEFNDPVEFRYTYESKYRSAWDKGQHTNLIVILRLKNTELLSLPYDLLQIGRKLSFSLSDLFPNMSYPVIEKLDRSLLDSLFDAHNKESHDRMGDNATKDFILRYVFGVAAELISTEVKLLEFLLRLHYKKTVIPSMLTDRLISILESNKVFNGWPLKKIIPDAEMFFSFLQERWPIFLSNLNTSIHLKEKHDAYGLKFNGHINIPFDHPDIRVYIDNLFVEGKLTPIKIHNLKIEKSSWIWSGIAESKTDKKDIRISRLFDLVDLDQLSMASRYTDWISFAIKWAELSSLIHRENNSQKNERYEKNSNRINELFAKWLEIRYSSLINLPPSTLAMLHHVSRRMALDIENQNSKRVALIVVDGLSLEQWVTIRDILHKQNDNLILREIGTFAWIPTLTSVSRQSIFAGKPPVYFPSSINSTNNEEKLWKQFWQEYGISKLDIAYKRGLRDGDAKTILNSFINPEQTKIVGLVIDKVDKIMHGMQLGSTGMHNQIEQWAKEEFLLKILNYLMEHKYEIWLTSDHGNIECEGQGRPAEGAIAESRGERVRIYPTQELRSKIYSSFTFSHEWPPLGLPENYFPLVATGHNAFVNKGERIVGHGGISIEEVIVPLVKIEQRMK